MKYLLRYSYYIGIALVFAALISLLTKDIRYELIAPFSLLGYMTRLYSDLMNHDADTNKRMLDKSAMKMLLIIFSITFFVVNIIFFRADGLICLVPIAYVFLENHFEVMKLFFLTIVCAIYLAMYTKLQGLWIILFLCGTLLISVGLFVFMRLRPAKK